MILSRLIAFAAFLALVCAIGSALSLAWGQP